MSVTQKMAFIPFDAPFREEEGEAGEPFGDAGDAGGGVPGGDMVL